MKTILFVDDHQVLANLSCEILEMQGYRAISAYDGSDALQKIERDEFDVVVTDYKMEGMNGVELAQKIHEKHPEIPVILVTGYGPVDGGKDVSACLDKEELFPALLERIQSCLRETEPEQVEETA
jgi:DNA-binding NtrC family response regulator